MDIIVTTPKKYRKVAAEEAELIKERGYGSYIHSLSSVPKHTQAGDKIFYVEDGYVRGFAIIQFIGTDSYSLDNHTTKFDGPHVVSDATTWTWIKPIKYKGFQGFRYFNMPYIVVGNWLAPKPPI